MKGSPKGPLRPAMDRPTGARIDPAVVTEEQAAEAVAAMAEAGLDLWPQMVAVMRLIGWVSINRRPPPKGKRVLAWAPDRHGEWQDEQPGLYAVATVDSAGVWSCLFEPTHWRPLPRSETLSRDTGDK